MRNGLIGVFICSLTLLHAACSSELTSTVNDTKVVKAELPLAKSVTDIVKSDLNKVANIQATKRASNDINLCEGLPPHNKNKVVVERMDKPPYNKPYIDPTFGAKVMRMTQAENDAVIKPMYNTIQAWNADESYLILYHTGGKETGHHLYDGKTYKHLQYLNISARDIEQVFWDTNSPDHLFYISTYFKYMGKFIRFNVKTGEKKVLKDFSSICGDDALPTNGNGTMMPSVDSDLFAFRCAIKDDITFSYRISTDTIVRGVSVKEGSKYSSYVSAIPSADGKKFWLGGYVLDLNFKELIKLDMDNPSEHSSVGTLANGHNAFFATGFDPSPKGCDGGDSSGIGVLVSYDMDNGKCRAIVGPDNGYGYTISGTHVSAVSYKNPGWVALSSIGYDSFKYHTNGKKAPTLFSEIYLANTDEDNPIVCRLAHHRSYGKHSDISKYHPYMGEPHATISPSGTRILFGSDWYDSGSVDTYVIELPMYK